MAKKTHSKNTDSLHPSVGEVKDRYLRRPSRRSNTNSRRVSNMNIHIEATGELVSSPRERETREMKERTATALHSNAGNPSLDDRHIATRDKGQLSNRNLRDPSYLGILSGRDCMVTPVGLILTPNRYMNFCLGIVFAVPLEIGSTSCRDGNKGICSSLGHGDLKSNSLLHRRWRKRKCK